MKQAVAGADITAAQTYKENDSQPAPVAIGEAQRKGISFTGRDAARNYRRFYRIACDFHEQHNPPPRRDDPRSEEYWARAADEITRISAENGNDVFLTGLLSVIFGELERESES